MGENTDQIERDLRIERAELGRNLQDLETRANELTDWRVHYRNRPELFLGAAAAIGLVLGAISAGSTQSLSRSGHRAGATLSDGRPLLERSPKAAQLVATWQHVSDAVLGVATAKVIDAIADRLPGFREQYERRAGG